MNNTTDIIEKARDYLAEHNAYNANMQVIDYLIEMINNEIDSLNDSEPDSPLIAELERLRDNLETLEGCAIAADDMGLNDGDDGRDPDNLWF